MNHTQCGGWNMHKFKFMHITRHSVKNKENNSVQMLFLRINGTWFATVSFRMSKMLFISLYICRTTDAAANNEFSLPSLSTEFLDKCRARKPFRTISFVVVNGLFFTSLTRFGGWHHCEFKPVRKSDQNVLSFSASSHYFIKCSEFTFSN